MNDLFRNAFGCAPGVVARAPGRVNLIGEHTDYNGGYVLPSALPQHTTALVARRTDRQVRALSAELDASSPVVFDLGHERRLESWADYVQGVTWALADRAIRVEGFDMLVRSTVPIGKGLSSSASLEIAVLRALREAFGLTLSDVEIAMIGHAAETQFVGAPVGIMDQMVCSVGDAQDALFLDTATLTFERIPIPAAVELAIIDSGIPHSHAAGEYRIRRKECEEAARMLGVRWLRDVSLENLPSVTTLPEPLNRRARHVVTENVRVLAAVDALEREDTDFLGQLFLQSHASMRDDFDVSLPEIDRLVEIAADHPDAYGARLTGGGFGGAIVVLCRRGTAMSVADRTLERYRAETQREGHVFLPLHSAA